MDIDFDLMDLYLMKGRGKKYYIDNFIITAVIISMYNGSYTR